MPPYATDIPDFRTEALRREAIVSWMNQMRAESEQHYWPYRRQLPKIYDLYRGVRTSRYHVHKNTIAVPLIYTIVWSHAARIINMVFGTNPAIKFIGAGETPEEAAIGRKRDNLWGAQFRDMRGIEKMLNVLINANLYGAGCIQHGWKFDKGKILTPSIESAPLSEQAVQTLIERDVVNFDGPDFEVLDNLDCFPQPGFKHHHDMQYFGRRYWLDIDQIEALAQPGVDAKESIFAPAEVRLLKQTSSGASHAIENLKAQRGLGMYNADDETARIRQRYRRPVELFECVGIHVPKELIPGDSQVTFRVITVANGKFLLRDKPFPLLLNKKPIEVCSLNPDPHFFFGPGRGEMAAKLQLGINKFTNQVLDALDVSIDPWFIFNRSAGIDPRNLMLRPGRWIPVTGSPSEMVMPGNPNLSGLEAGITVTQLLWQYMQRVSGILDESVIGVRGPGRETARGTLARSESVAVRLVLEALLFEQQVLEPLADASMTHNQQFLSLPRQFMILGDAMRIDQVTKKPIPVSRDIMNPGDLTGSYSARAMGTQMRMVRSDRMQDLLLMTQIIGQSPTLAAAASSAGWIRLLAREIGAGHEVNELINDNPAFNELLAAAGGNLENVPLLNQKEGTPGATGNLNALAHMIGAAAG